MVLCFKMNVELPAGTLNFTENWPLMYPSDILFCVLTYLAFVVKIGPILMEGRRPFNISKLLVVFNALKIINSGYLTYRFLLFIADKGLFQESFEHDKITIYIVAALYWKYMVTKVVDLLDTVLCVLRKKYSQVTFPHVYHHALMVLVSWACLKYDPSDHWAFMAAVDCAIHTIIYAYYGLAAMGPALGKYLWWKHWKQYLTVMQLIQLALVIGHVMIQASTSSCSISKGTYWIGLANLTLFICLFSDFYHRRYMNITREVGTDKVEVKRNVEFAYMYESD